MAGGLKVTEPRTLQFVLLWHEVPESFGRDSHWDLMIEQPDVAEEHRLATWAIKALPKAWAEPLQIENDSANLIEAIRLPDHRARYLDYEGPISGDRGQVSRFLAGNVSWLTATHEKCEVKLDVLDPVAFSGVLTLIANSGNDSTTWGLQWVGKPQ